MRIQCVFPIIIALCVTFTVTAQKWEWGIAPSYATASEALFRISSDGAGNIYVLGNTEGPASFEATSVASGIFLLKYNNRGKLIWGRQLPYQLLSSIKLSATWKGDVYLSGLFVKDTLKTDNKIFVTKGSTDFFVVKLNDAGVELWAKHFGSSAQDGLRDMIVKNEEVILTGYFYNAQSDSLVFNSNIYLKNPTPGPAMFVLKLDANGNAVWASGGRTDFNNGQFDYIGEHLALDHSGNIFVQGAEFGCTACSGIVVARFDDAGKMVRHFSWPGKFRNSGKFALYSENEMYFLTDDGKKYEEYYLSKCDTNGLVWELFSTTKGIYPTCSYIFAYDIQISPDGDIYNCGIFGCEPNGTQTSIDVYGKPMPFIGGYDLGIAKFNPQGQLQWIRTAGSLGYEDIWALHPTSDGAIYALGQYSNTNDPNGLVFNNDILKSPGNFSCGYLAKLNTSIIAGIDESVLDHHLDIFPIPSTGLLNVKGAPTGSKIKVLDLYGRCLKTCAVGADNEQLDLSSLAAGIYTLELMTANAKSYKKIVLE
jgi:hypothetical protein